MTSSEMQKKNMKIDSVTNMLDTCFVVDALSTIHRPTSIKRVSSYNSHQKFTSGDIDSGCGGTGSTGSRTATGGCFN